jgi:phage terminase small subunit
MPPRKPPKTTLKQEKFIEGVVQHGNAAKAARDAGYSPKTAKVIASENLTKPNVREHIERRKVAAMASAHIHTDVIVGSLVDIAMATLDDVLDSKGRFDIKKARANGSIHAVKRITPTQHGVSVEMYSRLDAIAQARDNFGMKQEPRANTYEETRRMEVEKEIDKISESEGCDRPTAARMLRDALGQDSPLIATVNKYVN